LSFLASDYVAKPDRFYANYLFEALLTFNVGATGDGCTVSFIVIYSRASSQFVSFVIY